MPVGLSKPVQLRLLAVPKDGQREKAHQVGDELGKHHQKPMPEVSLTVNRLPHWAMEIKDQERHRDSKKACIALKSSAAADERCRLERGADDLQHLIISGYSGIVGIVREYHRLPGQGWNLFLGDTKIFQRKGQTDSAHKLVH